MRLIFAPQTQVGLPEQWMYDLKNFRHEYESVLHSILKRLHGAHASRVQNFHEIAGRIVDMEAKLSKQMPDRKAWRDVRKPHVMFSKRHKSLGY